MTSVLLEGHDNRAMKLKHKFMGGGPTKEETRSFLNFSRENLSISHSDLERGFNKLRVWPKRNTILSVAALTIALLCLSLEIWQLRCAIEKTHEIEQLKRDIENLKHRFLRQDIKHEFKTLQEKLHIEEKKDNDSGEADIDNADYDFNYDENNSASHDYWDPYANMSLREILRELKKDSIWEYSDDYEEYNDEFEKDLRDYFKDIERKEEHKAQMSHEDIADTNSTERVLEEDRVSSEEHTESTSQQRKKESAKLKRSVNERNADFTTDKSNYQRDERYHSRSRTTARSYANDDSRSNDNTEVNPTSTVSWDRHPPKKYHAHAQETSLSVRDDESSEEITQPNGHTSEGLEGVGGGKTNWYPSSHTNVHHRGISNNRDQNFEMAVRELHRRVTRRHLRAPRQVYAIHYGADSTLFSTQDEHTGNGRARHNNGVFRAWRPSEWVAELGMNRHFTLVADGKLTVHETGLYLVYAQIHYLDEHDENGFHVLVNGKPIMQCMVFSPGIGHKSRSCFSAQVIFLQTGDHLILKDVGSARYTLFQHDKSFFGLVKIGEPRQQQQRHQSTTAQSMRQSH